MAIDAQQPSTGGSSSAGRRLFVGANVFVAILLVIGIVAALQYFAYKWAAKFDMTSSSVNSLSSGTENLVRGLESNVRLTSLYFETDRETKDQPLYRRAALDLLELYEATNRSKVKAANKILRTATHAVMQLPGVGIAGHVVHCCRALLQHLHASPGFSGQSYSRCPVIHDVCLPPAFAEGGRNDSSLDAAAFDSHPFP